MNLLFHKPFPAFHAPSILATRRFQRHQERLFAPQDKGRLFFAVIPDAETAARMAEVAGSLRMAFGLTGKPVAPARFAVPLLRVDGDDADEATERAESVAMPSFRAVFDRIGSFPNGALVLRGEEGTIGLEVLHQRLSDTFDARPGRARRFTPHVTLLRDRQRIEEQHVEPIEWTVREIVLVRGHRRLTTLPLG
ncbi:MAG TPA: 2'-5' RNA ligase family protein [Reyranella sp.]|nr:2'-5' RNA ligase family protein [Reyranella sp.]